jgi:hypothetical protein
VSRKFEERKRERTVDELVADYCLWLDRRKGSPKHKADEKRQTRQASGWLRSGAFRPRSCASAVS